MFENAGSRAIIADGWKAVCKHEPGADYETEPWELYDLRTDRSECEDLATADPERLAALVELWWEEAERHGVLPLDDRTMGLFAARFRDGSPHPVDRRYVYRPPMSPLPTQAAAPIGGRSFDLTATVDLAAGDEGVLSATGTAGAGLSFFVQGGRLVLDYNAFGDHVVLESTGRLEPGRHDLTLRVRRLDGRAGTAALAVDGVDQGAADLPLLMRIISSVGPSIGRDHGSPVSDRYDPPFPFTGDLHEVVVQASPERTAADTVAAEDHAGMNRQ